MASSARSRSLPRAETKDGFKRVAVVAHGRTVVLVSGLTAALMVGGAKRRWNVAAMNLAHRMHKLGLLSEWQVRSTYMQMGRLGYRDGEPVGIERETSQVLPKVFDALRSEGMSRRDVQRHA